MSVNTFATYMEGIISKDQAIEAMLKGQKVTHAMFVEGEFIEGRDGSIMDENNIYLGPIEGGEFWDVRKGPIWDTNWLIIE